MICIIMTINDDSDNYSKIEKFIIIDAYKYKGKYKVNNLNYRSIL